VTPLTLRAATRDDARRLAENSLLSYPDAEWGVARRAERYLTGPYPIEGITVAERDGELVGQARTIPYRGWFGGVESAVGGLAGVAVAPEARRTGVAAALVRHHVSELQLAAAPWSMLYPFAPTSTPPTAGRRRRAACAGASPRRRCPASRSGRGCAGCASTIRATCRRCTRPTPVTAWR
jgi:GNAT superfamily N-acetyltransferase